jgi:quercetin dioxygenase-like cupin family protein
VSGPSAVIRQVSEGEELWFAGGGILTVKASAEETSGSCSVFEDVVVRGKTTPLHTHPNGDEAIYLLEGELLVHADGDEHLVGEGGFVFVPRGVPHALLVTSETARLLVLLTPGDQEAFFRDAGEPIASPADATRPPDIERLRAVAERSPTIELLGPPPFEAEAAAPRS